METSQIWRNKKVLSMSLSLMLLVLIVHFSSEEESLRNGVLETERGERRQKWPALSSTTPTHPPTTTTTTYLPSSQCPITLEVIRWCMCRDSTWSRCAATWPCPPATAWTPPLPATLRTSLAWGRGRRSLWRGGEWDSSRPPTQISAATKSTPPAQPPLMEDCRRGLGANKSQRWTELVKADSLPDLYQELAELLVSLDEATALAERLKKRSEEMLGSLGSELATIKERGLAI